MLPPFIIDQIRRREEEERRKDLERPVLDIPLPYPVKPPAGRAEDESGGEKRGVIIIDVVG